MISWLILLQLWRHGFRLLLKAFGVYLLPWARAADLLAAFITRRHVRLRPWTWHLSACFVALAVVLQVATAIPYVGSLEVFLDIRGYLAPCVCEGCVQSARRPAPNSMLGELLISLSELTHAVIRTGAAISRCFSVLCLSVLGHPWLSLGIFVLGVLIS